MSEQHGGAAQGSFPPGWYPLPDGLRERYWNGAAWTDSVRPRVPAPGAVPPPPAFPPSGAAPVAQHYLGPAPLHGPAIASMVLGIVSLLFICGGVVTGIIGLVLGVTSLQHVQPRGPKRGRGMAIAGITCSAIALAMWGLALVWSLGGRL